MTEKQEKELCERQPSWTTRWIHILSVAGIFILIGAAISSGVAIFTWQYKDFCPEGGECKTLVWHPGLLSLRIYVLACVAIALQKMIRVMRKREVRQLRTALALLAVTFSLIPAVWCMLLIDNSSYKRHGYRSSSDDLYEIYDCNPSNSTPPAEENSKWGPYKRGFTNEGLTWEAWNRGLTGNIANKGFRSGDDISHMVSPLQGKPTVDKRTTRQGIGTAILQNAL